MAVYLSRALQLSVQGFGVYLRCSNFLCSTSGSSVSESSCEYLDSVLGALDVFVSVITILNLVCILIVYKFFVNKSIPHWPWRLNWSQYSLCVKID
jgi:hypothetical protein